MTTRLDAPPSFPGPAPDPQLAAALANFLGQPPEPGLIEAVKSRLAAPPVALPRPQYGRHATISATCRKCGAGADNPKVYWLWSRDNFSTCFYCGTTPQQPIQM